MTRERAKEVLPVIQAFAEGKTVQCFLNGWQDHAGSADEISDLTLEWRIKPEPREFIIEVKEDGKARFAWAVGKEIVPLCSDGLELVKAVEVPQ